MTQAPQRPVAGRPARQQDRFTIPRYRPGTMAVRVDDFLMEQTRDADGRLILDDDSRPVEACTGVWGTSLCSGQLVFVRLSTADEEHRDGNRNGVSPGRRSLDDLRAGLAGVCPEGRPDLLEPEDRPVWRLDRARPLLDGYGRPFASRRAGVSEPYMQMRCSWIVPYNGYVSREGDWMRPASNMEFTSPATVNVSLLSRCQPPSINSWNIYQDSIRDCVARLEPSFMCACREAGTRIVGAWHTARRDDPAARFGGLSVTTWRPERHCRFDLADSTGEGRQFMQRWLSDPLFGYGSEGPHPVTPDCLLRFINASGEACGIWRVRSWDMVSLPPGPDAHGRERDWISSPESRADSFMRNYVQDIDQDFIAREGVTHVDVLPGWCHAASRGLLMPDAPGRERAVMAQVRGMVALGLLQTRSPLPARRLSPGCAQAMVTRSPNGWVNGFFALRDGRSEHCAALLMPGMERLEPSASLRAGLEAEEHAMKHLSETIRELEQKSGNDDTPGPVPA